MYHQMLIFCIASYHLYIEVLFLLPLQPYLYTTILEIFSLVLYFSRHLLFLFRKTILLHLIIFFIPRNKFFMLYWMIWSVNFTRGCRLICSFIFIYVLNIYNFFILIGHFRIYIMYIFYCVFKFL